MNTKYTKVFIERIGSNRFLLNFDEYSIVCGGEVEDTRRIAVDKQDLFSILEEKLCFEKK